METLIGSIFTGLTAVLIAVGGLYAQAGTKRKVDRKAYNAEIRRLEMQFIAARRWGIRNEQLLQDNQLESVPRPAELDINWGLEEDEDPDPPPRRKALSP